MSAFLFICQNLVGFLNIQEDLNGIRFFADIRVESPSCFMVGAPNFIRSGIRKDI